MMLSNYNNVLISATWCSLVEKGVVHPSSFVKVIFEFQSSMSYPMDRYSPPSHVHTTHGLMMTINKSHPDSNSLVILTNIEILQHFLSVTSGAAECVSSGMEAIGQPERSPRISFLSLPATLKEVS